MIRSLLAGRKSQTRRVIKPQPVIDGGWEGSPEWALSWRENEDGCSPDELAGLCPYGKPGDMLWVREAWQLHTRATDLGKVVYRASQNASHTEFHQLVPVDRLGHIQPKPFQEGYRPSIHMPRCASRLTLEITGVRVERLQDISEADAQAEGCDHNGPCDHKRYSCEDIGCFGRDSYRGGFAEIWWSINGPGSWEANPWVWVLEFTLRRCNVDELLKARAA